MRKEKLRVIVWGLGAMGKGIVETLLKKKGVELISLIARGDKIGKTLYKDLTTTSFDEGIKEGAADIVIIATDSYTKDSFDKIKYCIERGMNVISIGEEMVYPKTKEADLAKELDRIAKENGVTILGTGINPGLIMDLLVITLTGACIDVDTIRAERINNLSPFGPKVMHEQGVGISEQEFNKRIQDDDLAGHIGFPESINMISDALGWKLSDIVLDKSPIISSVYRKSTYAQVQAGEVAGCNMEGYGYIDNELKIEMLHPQQIEPQLEGIDTGDYITIKGRPDINMEIKPEVPGGIGTIAMSINMIPHVINARPGLKTMLDLPVPRAIMGDMRDLIE